MSTTDHARELLEGLHLQAHEGGPTTDLSTHYRRAARLWNAAAPGFKNARLEGLTVTSAGESFTLTRDDVARLDEVDS